MAATRPQIHPLPEESFEPSYPCSVDDLVSVEELVCSSCGNTIPDCACSPDRDSISEWE